MSEKSSIFTLPIMLKILGLYRNNGWICSDHFKTLYSSWKGYFYDTPHRIFTISILI
jgi:hypothetical protein